MTSIDLARQGTAAQLALAVTSFFGRPMRASLIRRWESEGRIKSTGTDVRGTRLYRLGDVLDLDATRVLRPRHAGPARLSGK